jgi:hypothetical protein
VRRRIFGFLTTDTTVRMQSLVDSWPHFQDLSLRVKDNAWPALIISSVLSYLALVRFLRFRAINKLKDAYAPFVKDPYSMDYKKAHEIMRFSMLYEFPWMFFFGTSLALIKTYSIESGTALLVQTRQLTTDSNVGKRAEDTGVLISEFVVGSVDSERGLRALSKVNWLHRRYGSKVGNEEMIHTLAMFVLEPHRWIEENEWRPMTELEKVATFVYWKEIGNRMGIIGIPETLEKLMAWVESFEQVHMIYTENNRICAETTMNMYLRNIPWFLREFVRDAANSLLEPRVRLALGSPKPSWTAQKFASSILLGRRWIVGNLLLPRLYNKDVLAKPRSDGRLQRESFAFEPWYVKSSVLGRLGAWLWSGGRLNVGPKYKSDGYLPEELGPVEYEKSSKESVLKQAEAMKKYAQSGGAAVMGCPFSLKG